MFIFFFFNKKAYAPPDTILSKAFPKPKSNAMPIKVGFHTPARYKIKATP